MNKTSKELLQPRYKVIADYPNSIFEINDVIDVVEDMYYLEGYTEGFFSPYPHLFRKLEWWEERGEEDMPKKVKLITGKNKRILDIISYNQEFKRLNFKNGFLDLDVPFKTYEVIPVD